MHAELLNNGIPIPGEMKHNLMILHSYILARLHVKRQEQINYRTGTYMPFNPTWTGEEGEGRELTPVDYLPCSE